LFDTVAQRLRGFDEPTRFRFWCRGLSPLSVAAVPVVRRSSHRACTTGWRRPINRAT